MTVSSYYQHLAAVIQNQVTPKLTERQKQVQKPIPDTTKKRGRPPKQTDVLKKEVVHD